MKTNVIVKLQVEGLHHWPGVVEYPQLEQVHFLKALHRHMFHITVKKEVSHDDRDVEIIMLKRNILDYLQKRYWTENANTHFFGSMSCEMIAKELGKFFGLHYCEVLEDGENGAEFIQNEITETELIEYKEGNPDWVEPDCDDCNENNRYVPSYEDYLNWTNSINLKNNVSTTIDPQLKFGF